MLFLIFSIKEEFFRPPPQIKTFHALSLSFNLDKKLESPNPIIFPVKSVSVAAPSSKLRPLTKPKLKSLVSKDNLF